jgi:hypothetical protein
VMVWMVTQEKNVFKEHLTWLDGDILIGIFYYN